MTDQLRLDLDDGDLRTGPRIESVPLGPATFDALSDAIIEAKGTDPLAPVTVIVPSNFVGLAARRRLVRSGVSLVNTSFATPYQVASEIAAAKESRRGMRPLTNAVLGAAVRNALVTTASQFESVAHHRSTETTFVRNYRELSRVRPATLTALESSGTSRARDAVAIFRAIDDNLAGYVNEDHLAQAAAEFAHEPKHRSQLGVVVCFLVEGITPALGDLMRVLAESGPTTIIAGMSGRPSADKNAYRWLWPMGWTSTAGHTPPAATELIDAADADDEVRAVVRDIAGRLDSGQALDRIAVFYPTNDPYASALREHLSEAMIPFNGPSGRTVLSSFCGRALLRLMDIAFAARDARLRRWEVIDLAASGPLRSFDGEPLRPRLWDQISKRAGVVQGADDWESKLARFDEVLVEQCEQAENDGYSPGHIAAIKREREEVKRLRAFVANLAAATDDHQVPSTWAERSNWLRELLEALLPPTNHRSSWPEHELDAADRVADALVAVSVLDSIEPHPTSAAFVRSVTSLLDRPTGRDGKFGVGVTIAPIEHGLGMDADTIYVVGMVEGICPSPRREDTVLSDTDRTLAVDGELRVGLDRLDEDHRSFLGALAAGRERILTTCRVDLRRGRSLLPSRWLLESASVMAGKTIHSSDWPDLDCHQIRRHASFFGALLRTETASSPTEFDLARLARVAMASGKDAAIADPVVGQQPDLQTGFAMLAARRSGTFNEFDGHVGTVDVKPRTTTSASRLETWATCPMRYFLSYELGLGSIDDPEARLDMTPMDRGEMWHLILERFIGEQIEPERDKRIAPGEAWTQAHRDRLHDIATEVFDHYEQQGRTGKALLWRETKREIREDLDTFLVEDNAYRRKYDCVPEATELRIRRSADTGDASLSLTVGNDRQLDLRGFIDRVDLANDGTPIVADYKTGRQPQREQAVLDADPVAAGSRLQLALYGLAAAAHFGADSAKASYWFTSAKGKFARSTVSVDEATAHRCRDVVKQIDSGIEAGVFPINSGSYNNFFMEFENCRYCEFSPICPVDRDHKASAWGTDAAAASFVGLALSEDES